MGSDVSNFVTSNQLYFEVIVTSYFFEVTVTVTSYFLNK